MRALPIPAPWHYETTPEGKVTIWATRSGDDDKHILGMSQFGPLEQREANARRICLAINMPDCGAEAFSVLSDVRDVLEGLNDDKINEELLPTVNAVLAKAGGERVSL